MKKLLSILLTLVMAVCLINLNNSNTKAENENPTNAISYAIYFCNDGVLRKNSTTGYDLDADPDNKHELQDLGITHTGNTITLSQNIATTSFSYLFKIEHDVVFELTNDVELSGTSMVILCPIHSLNNNITINGNGHKMTISSLNQSNHGIVCNETLTLNDIDLVVNGDMGDLSILANNIAINGKSSVVLNNIGTIGSLFSALKVDGTLTMPNTYEILGSPSSNPLETDLKVAVKDTDNIFKVVDEGGNLQNAKYIVIRKKQQPAPTPDPQPKDESCEKVIGPTWHWNNDKGICEDYGVVGTYTR